MNEVKGTEQVKSERELKIFDVISVSLSDADLQEQNSILLGLTQNIINQRKEMYDKLSCEKDAFGKSIDKLMEGLKNIG